ncbi:MAG: hypothetical protein MJK04_18775, partial [Psychrosphaera sp.]|nr:hypothetical protein [Psychrosphaera sp.]
PKYFYCTLGGEGRHKDELITIPPGDLIQRYTNLLEFFDENNPHQWTFQNFSWEYFLLCVQFCGDRQRLDSGRLSRALPRMYEILLSQKDADLRAYRLKLKQQLMAAADKNHYLKSALDVARQRLAE